MRPARILLLVVAIVAGGLAAFLATRGNTPTTQTVTVTQVQQEKRTQVLVASQPIGVGERLNAKVLEWQDWPVGAVRPEYVTIEAVPDATEKLTGAVARFEFFIGEPIREAKLARADQGYLSAVIQQGMRAVSIAVTATSSAGGFVVPNDQVDVILTRNTASGEQSETILFNVKVLAIGQRLGELSKSGGNESGEEDPQAKTFQGATIATLELSPRQSETAINAAEVGRLALTLRSVVDFAEKIAPGHQGNSSTIRMIRHGKAINIVTGAESPVATPAAFTPVNGNGIPAQDREPQFPQGTIGNGLAPTPTVLQ